MKILLTVLLAGFCLITVACAKHEVEIQPPSPKADPLSTQQLMAYLSHDNKRGRKTGTVEMLNIQKWLINEFSSAGVKPLPGSKTYLQPFEVESKNGNLAAANVMGYISCNCDSDRYMIIGAHYDHVGINTKLEGDQIFNGADDDASGVVATILIARKLAEETSLPFNIIVAAWDAEEMGLLGSKHFVDNPLVPLEKIETGFMFELVGSKSEKNTAWMTGFEYSSLYPLMKSQMKLQGWELGQDPFPAQMLFTRSDNAPFALMDMTQDKSKAVFRDGKKADIQGLPIHAMSIWKGQNHYHKVNDDINVIDIENLTNFAHAIAASIASIPEGTTIKWLDNSHFNFKRP